MYLFETNTILIKSPLNIADVAKKYYNISLAIQQIQPKKVVQPKIFYEQYNDWQDYDPNVVDNKNGYGESSSNGYYEANIANEIITEDEIITEEYITNEADLGKFISQCG